ncbi:GL12756 [Drosophila persimilis]|uniref:GL12756 n=1 Tax=Drosophila persimilis TaxID=7234 RepID=B4H7R6_DROPE|nr:GL12756 [Drosophila persimilis]
MLLGCVQFQCGAETKHEGIILYLEGVVNLQLSSKTVGLFDAFYNSVKPINLLQNNLELSAPGKLSAGRSDIMVQHTEAAIKSIDMQLVRVETCGCDEGYSKDATEIQTIQIADGNVLPKLELPIYMVLPRLFTCPTLLTKNFKIEFELNLVVVFKEDYTVSENFKIVFKRSAGPLPSKMTTAGR